jgi:hypothetical protein
MIKNLKNSTTTSMSHPLPHRKKSFVTNTFKYLLAISSMAGTLGIWTLLANNDLVIAQDKTNGQTAPEANLDPIPTLVPILCSYCRYRGCSITRSCAPCCINCRFSNNNFGRKCVVAFIRKSKCACYYLFRTSS